MAALAARGRELTDLETAIRGELDELLLGLPNIPARGRARPPTRCCARSARPGATGRDHLALAGSMIDMEHGAALSGSRFAYLRGDLVLVELALVQYVMGKLIAQGFEPVIPPVLVRERALYRDRLCCPTPSSRSTSLPEDDLYLVGTSEVALASLHRDEILDADGAAAALRRLLALLPPRGGAAGKDTRGIFRVHQFDKVEMFTFVEPDTSAEEHERILAIEESILTELQIPYRVVAIAVDDLGASAAKKYDCEAWMPGQGQSARSPRARTRPTTRHGAWRSATARPTAGPRPCTR